MLLNSKKCYHVGFAVKYNNVLTYHYRINDDVIEELNVLRDLDFIFVKNVTPVLDRVIIKKYKKSSLIKNFYGTVLTMGKRYYCDYCNKTMAITPSIVRNHKNGIAHQKLVNEHYQQYKDPSTILREESRKKPCKKNATGECIFGSICYFSHYTPEEMNVLRQQVAAQVRTQSTYQIQPSFAELYNKLQMEKSTKPQKAVETTLFDRNGVTYTFPWVYNEVFDMYGDSLPPSLKRLKIDDFLNANFTEWG